MRSNLLFLLGFLVCFALLPFSVLAQEERLVVGGSSTVTNFVFHDYEQQIRDETQIPFDVITSSSGRGLLALHQGNIDIAMISSEIEPLIEKLGKAGHVIDINQYDIHNVSEIGVLYVVHPDNPLETLTPEQVVAVFTGDMTGWSELNIDDMSVNMIKVVTEHPTGGVYNTIVKKGLEGKDFAKDKIVMQNAPQVALVVSQLPNSFGFLSDATPENQRRGVKVLDVPDLDIKQVMFLVTKKDDQREQVQNLVSHISHMFQK